jgi:hypothetical protein
VAHLGLGVRRPQAMQGLALQLAAEEGAQTRAAEAEGGLSVGTDLEDERIGEDVPDLAGLDLAALGGGALAAQAVPIREQHP